jgi:hypothetical protein
VVPQTFGGVVYLLVVAVTLCGLALLAFDSWRRGVGLVGLGLIVGAALRLMLAEDNAGMLRVRSRLFDVVSLAGVGIALIVLAANIPDQPRL